VSGTGDRMQLIWRGALSDYITALAWSPDGHNLAVASAAGKVLVYRDQSAERELLWLQGADGTSIDTVAFSADGAYLATAGQAGRVRVWGLRAEPPRAIATLTPAGVWIDQLAWHPTQPQLAISLGRTVAIWDLPTQTVSTTLEFGPSSVMGLAWRPDGSQLAVGGYLGAQLWSSRDWAAPTTHLAVLSASAVLAWSADGRYLASGNLDRNLTVWDHHGDESWLMRGFPGKIRQLSWSEGEASRSHSPLLAASSADGISVWQYNQTTANWDGWLLTGHEQPVQGLQFQPRGQFLASAGQEGRLCLWTQARTLSQVWQPAASGLTGLVWRPQGTQLAAGTADGTVWVWGPE
jgi:WD40 repeat protein